MNALEPHTAKLITPILNNSGTCRSAILSMRDLSGEDNLHTSKAGEMPQSKSAALKHTRQHNPYLRSTTTVMRLLLWLSLSSGIILMNKWILSPQRFPFPVTLAFWHMLFCSAVGVIMVRAHVVPKEEISWHTFFRLCAPVGALGAAALTLGNAAFIYLSVAFAQMLKANMPVIMFVMGCFLQIDMFSWGTCAIMVTIGAGVAASSLGELQFSALGSSFMLLAMLAEAFKMILLQRMMQHADLQITPVNALYHVMPVSTLCLLPVMLLLEAQQLWNASTLLRSEAPLLLASAVAACLLNVVAFWVVSNTSALTMKLAGIVKDAVLIITSALLFDTRLTVLGLGGYAVALSGIGMHNYQSLTKVPAPASSISEPQEPLLEKVSGKT